MKRVLGLIVIVTMVLGLSLSSYASYSYSESINVERTWAGSESDNETGTIYAYKIRVECNAYVFGEMGGDWYGDSWGSSEATNNDDVSLYSSAAAYYPDGPYSDSDYDTWSTNNRSEYFDYELDVAAYIFGSPTWEVSVGASAVIKWS